MRWVAFPVDAESFAAPCADGESEQRSRGAGARCNSASGACRALQVFHPAEILLPSMVGNKSATTNGPAQEQRGAHRLLAFELCPDP